MAKQNYKVIVLMLVAMIATACASSPPATATATGAPDNIVATQAPSVTETTAPTETSSPAPTITATPVPAETTEQTEDTTMAIRDIENGTKIIMHFGDTLIPGTLNDSAPARELISRLPYTVHASRYDFDICGVIEPLTFSDEDLVPGWKNGDIDFTVMGDYFTILFDNEEEAYGQFVNLGVIDCDPALIDELHGSFDILIELAP